MSLVVSAYSVTKSRTQTAHLSFHNWLMICSGKTQNPDMRQSQKVVDLKKKIILVCHSPVYSLNFVRLSDKLLSLASHPLLRWALVTSQAHGEKCQVSTPHQCLKQPSWVLSQIFSCLFSSARKWFLSFPSLPSSTAHGKIFYRTRIVICPWSAELQGFVFICHFFSSCLKFIAAIAKQDCCRWSFLSPSSPPPPPSPQCQKSHVQ